MPEANLLAVAAEIDQLVSLSDGIHGDVDSKVLALKNRIRDTPVLTYSPDDNSIRLSDCGGRVVAKWQPAERVRRKLMARR
jgi:hypothetical protein